MSQHGKALGLSLSTEDADSLIYFCYFSSNDDGAAYPDIAINRDVGDFSSPFLFSFSMQDPSLSVQTCYEWGNYEPQNWLL